VPERIVILEHQRIVNRKGEVFGRDGFATAYTFVEVLAWIASHRRIFSRVQLRKPDEVVEVF
jgi:hypothetical protein